MSRHRMHAPIDPECPANPLNDFFDDPMTIASGCGDELGSLLEDRHRASCARCQEYGAANIEVSD